MDVPPGVQVPHGLLTVGRLRPTAVTGILVVTAALLVVLSALTANQWLMLAPGAAIGLILATAFNRTDLAGLVVQCSGATRVAAGAPVEHEITLLNHGQHPLPAFHMCLRLGGLRDAVITVPALAPGSQASAQVSRPAGRRGRLGEASLHAVITEPLGLFRRIYPFTVELPLVIYPAPAKPETVLRTASATASLAPGQRSSSELEFAGLRSWRRGDESRKIHWRATARRGKLVVLEQDAPADTQWVAALSASPRTSADEYVLSVLLATWVQQTVPPRVVAWTSPTGSTVAPAHLSGFQDWLADLVDLRTPSPEELLHQLPRECTEFTLIRMEDTPATWATQVQGLAAAAGISVQG